MKYDLVFEGGGAKGMVFVGALQEFEAVGYNYDRLLGTSAGAITVALLAARYTAAEMLEALSEKEGDKSVFAGFMGEPEPFSQEEIKQSATRAFLKNLDLPYVPNFIEKKLDKWLFKKLTTGKKFRNLFSLIERGGWYSASKFITWLENKLDTGMYDQNTPRQFSKMTLSQFFEATDYELTLIASDTTASRLMILNHRTAPDCPVVWAVRMSMNIPLIWPEVKWQADWGPYRGLDISGNLIVDGGVLSNFPIELFVSDQSYVLEIMGQKQSNQVLGFLIDENLSVNNNNETSTVEEKGFDLSTTETIKRISRLITTATRAHDKMVIEACRDNVVRLPAKGYSTTEFDMPDERRNILVAAGRQAMQQYLNTQTGGLIRVSRDAMNMMPVTYTDDIAMKMLAM